MEINGLKVVMGRKENTNITEFLNPDFLKLLEKKMEDVKIIHLGIAVDSGDDESLISLAHACPEHSQKDILTIKVGKEEKMDEILEIIKSFKGE